MDSQAKLKGKPMDSQARLKRRHEFSGKVQVRTYGFVNTNLWILKISSSVDLWFSKHNPVDA